MTEQGINLNDTVVAFLLLSSCQLSEGHMSLVMSSIGMVTYDAMKSVLSSIIVNPKITLESCRKSESEHLPHNKITQKGLVGTVTDAVMSSYSSVGDSKAQRLQQSGDTARCILNVRNRYGKVSQCFVCKSKFHLFRACPQRRKNSMELEKTENNDDSENLNVTMFLGYSNGAAKSEKLNKLVQDSSGHALLDSGCSRTVCGVSWLNDYMGTLTDYDKSSIVESDSDASFTFGDGVNISSLKRVVLPCYIHGKRCEIETDVVDCKVPLLLSKKAMKRGKMCLDFEKDTVVIGGKPLKLNVSSAGHYLMPLLL